MEEICKMLGELGAPVYFIYGNHDLQLSASDVGGRTYSDDELKNAIESNGIIILRDEYVTIDDDLVILGRDDFSSDKKSVEDLPEIPSERYFITVDHAPYQYDDIVKTGADLQLSGHVHAAQLFPLSILYTFKVDNIYGSYRMGSTDIYVSSGFSVWAFPFRTEAHCNYEVIILKPDPE